MRGKKVGKKVMVPVNEMLQARAAELGPGGQAILARQIGVQEATVSRWIHRGAIPSEGRAADIAAALGTDETRVLAAIAMARKIRHQSNAIDAYNSDEPIQRLSEQMDAIAKRLAAVEKLLREMRGPGGSPRGERNTH